VNFYVMGVGIYDEKPHEVRLTSYGESVMRSKNGQVGPQRWSYRKGLAHCLCLWVICRRRNRLFREQE
jgi:phage gp16-like protein